jgi:hypothetical protein
VGATRLMFDNQILQRFGFWCDAAFGAGLIFFLF